MGESPAYSNYYDTEPYTDADLNSDNYISIYESWKWEQTHETKNETPLYSDLGNIGSFTSLMYPTLLHTDITITGCNFTNSGGNNLTGISIWNYDNYTISDNTISGYSDGLFISISGVGPAVSQNISANEIFNCTNSAVHIYNSISTLNLNHIHNNLKGIRLYNNSNIDLTGNSLLIITKILSRIRIHPKTAFSLLLIWAMFTF